MIRWFDVIFEDGEVHINMPAYLIPIWSGSPQIPVAWEFLVRNLLQFRALL